MLHDAAFIPTRIDRFGLWVDIGNSKWCAEKGDALSGLAIDEYQASYDDWQCLWPDRNTSNHGFPHVIWEGDVYDASNLAATSGKTLEVRFEEEFGDYGDIFPKSDPVSP